MSNSHSYLYRGRHRRKPKLNLWFGMSLGEYSIASVCVVIFTAIFGLVLNQNQVVSSEAALPTSLAPVPPLPAESVLPSPSSIAPSLVTALAPDPRDLLRGSKDGSEGDVGSLLTRSTSPTTSRVPTQDQQASRSSSAAPRPAPPTTTKAIPVPAPQISTQNQPPIQSQPSQNTKCSGLGVVGYVESACNLIMANAPGATSIGGRDERAGNPNSCHPKGLALDFMVGSNTAVGNRIFQYVKANRSQLRASPVILWQVSDHFDHVHVSFEPCTG